MSSPPFSIKFSAPGKVILFGEYSVIYNKPAIAATLSLYTKLHLYQTDSDKIDLNLSLIDLNKSFALNDIKNHFSIAPTDSWDAYITQLTKAFDSFYEKTCKGSYLSEAQKFALMAFFHCFKNLFNSSSRGFGLKVDSELPVGAGLGSSASFSTVLSASALMLEHVISSKKASDLIGRTENGRIAISKKFNDLISELAFSCEKIFHGTPSGVDHNTILSGSMLEFIKSSDGNNKMTSINTSPLKILLVNTNVPRSTKKLVANFKQLKENHPDVINCVLNGMENVAKSAVKDLMGFKDQGNKTELETHFGELVSLNHGLLRVLGASHPSLEQLVSTADKYNLKAKLTGAGGGGFGFVYVPSNVETSVIKIVEEELTIAGFKVYDVSLGGPGLEIEELIL